MTDRYTELRAALESATPGPWEFINHNNEPEESTPSDDWEIVSKVTEKTVCSEPQCNCVSLPAVCDGPYIAAANPHTISALLAERDALLDQHHRDSKELRRLCAQRDAARKVSKEAGAVIAGLKAERDDLRGALVIIATTHQIEAMLDPQRAVRIARAALAQEHGEKHDNQD